MSLEGCSVRCGNANHCGTVHTVTMGYADLHTRWVFREMCRIVIQFCPQSRRGKNVRHQDERKNMKVLVQYYAEFDDFTLIFCPTDALKCMFWFCLMLNNSCFVFPGFGTSKQGLQTWTMCFGSYIQFNLNRPERAEMCCMCLKINKFHTCFLFSGSVPLEVKVQPPMEFPVFH